MRIKLLNHGMAQICADTSYELEPIREYFSTPNKSKFYVEYHCPNVSVNDFVYGITSIGCFKVGLLPLIIKVMDKLNISHEIDTDVLREFLPIRVNKLTITPHSLPCEGGKDFETRQYQTDAINKLLKHGRGVVVLPTASGKSFVVAKTLWSFLQSSKKIKHCLILVPTTSLVIQFYKDLLDYGLPEDSISMFSSKKKKCGDTEIIISNRAWLNNHKNELPPIDVLFVDECHGLKTSSGISKMVADFKTNIRLGCTATLPVAIEDKWSVIGLLGPVLYTQSIVSMQESKYISNLSVTSITTKDINIQKDTQCLFSMRRKVSSDDIQEAYELERKYIVDNLPKLYSNAVDHIMLITQDTNTLFLFDFIPFGKELFKLIEARLGKNSKVVYIDGSIDVDEREKIRLMVEDNENVFVVAQSTCFSTGINIKNLHNIAFVFNSKSSTKVLQSIGRGLRNHKSKTHVDLFDINFNFKYSKRHFSERKKIYKNSYNKEIDTTVKFTV